MFEALRKYLISHDELLRMQEDANDEILPIMREVLQCDPDDVERQGTFIYVANMPNKHIVSLTVYPYENSVSISDTRTSWYTDVDMKSETFGDDIVAALKLSKRRAELGLAADHPEAFEKSPKQVYEEWKNDEF